MSQNLQSEIAIRDQLIAGMEREITIQNKLIRQQNELIQTLEQQLDGLKELLSEILHS